MKTFVTLLSTICILGVIFFGLSTLSKQNEFTSVREYLLKDTTTGGKNIEINSGTIKDIFNNTGTINNDIIPPIIEIMNYKNADIITQESVNIEVQASDNISESKNIKITGNGLHLLEKGFNPIVVSATDQAGNIATTYIILERK